MERINVMSKSNFTSGELNRIYYNFLDDLNKDRIEIDMIRFEGPDFINQVVEIEWNGEPKSLLLECLEVERRLGRIRPTGGPRYTSRRIDIDLILTNPFMTLADAELELPHPRMHERRFVLQPLAEHWSDWKANVLGDSVAELKAMCADQNAVHLFSNSNKNDS